MSVESPSPRMVRLVDFYRDRCAKTTALKWIREGADGNHWVRNHIDEKDTNFRHRSGYAPPNNPYTRFERLPEGQRRVFIVMSGAAHSWFHKKVGPTYCRARLPVGNESRRRP